jgi:TIR domain-containing protein/SIR2-like protein
MIPDQEPLPQPRWDDDTWEVLLASIGKHRVIPIVGPALSNVEVDGRQVSVNQYVAEKLVERLGIPRADLSKNPTLNEVASRHMRSSGLHSELYPKIANILKEAVFVPPKALVQLAEIRHFNLFVTTAFDSLLETAINNVRFGGAKQARCIGYVPNEMPDCDIKPGQRKLPVPTVYHLFGKSAYLPEHVISDEDLLEYMCALQSDKRPENLIDELKSNYLLVLGGSNFSDWLTPLFLRIVKRQRLSDRREPDDILEILADEQTRADVGLVRFLSNYSPATKFFAAKPPLAASAHEFVAELWQRWTDRFGDKPDEANYAASSDDTPMPTGAVFISYAHEDQEAVRKLRQGLEARGLSVWYDKDRLGGGDTYDEKIHHNINACGIFVAVLSRAADKRVKDAYFRREWRWALDRDTRYAQNVRFIVPVIVDGARESDFTSLPPRFRELHMEKLPGGDVTADFAGMLKSSL